MRIKDIASLIVKAIPITCRRAGFISSGRPKTVNRILSNNMFLRFDNETWRTVKDGNFIAREIFNRHYSRYFYKDGRRPKLFVGPGEKMVLLTPECDALFVWRKFLSGDGQQGINCAVFRNESQRLSSSLILEAMELAWDKWPNERLYTYVNSKRIRSSNPGCCFLKAGWKRCGVTKVNKLIILECLPSALAKAA